MRLKSLSVAVLLAFCVTTKAEDPKPVLQVIRLKQGESKTVELALSGAKFQPVSYTSRDSLELSVLPPEREGKPTIIPRESKDNRFTGRYLVSPDFTFVWSKEKPELEFQAGKDMKKGTTDLKIYYHSFGGGNHIIGFRVIVE